MKNPLRILVLAVALSTAATLPVAFTGCSTAPSSRVAQVQTLKVVGQSADTAVALSAQAYRDGRITAAQARQVMDLYDTKFQPAFRIARDAVKANLDSIASPELVVIAEEISALVVSFNLQPK